MRWIILQVLCGWIREQTAAKWNLSLAYNKAARDSIPKWLMAPLLLSMGAFALAKQDALAARDVLILDTSGGILGALTLGAIIYYRRKYGHAHPQISLVAYTQMYRRRHLRKQLRRILIILALWAAILALIAILSWISKHRRGAF